MGTQTPLQENLIHDPHQKQKQQEPQQSFSPLSSPSHEFSFTITLHPSPTSSPTTFIKPSSTTKHSHSSPSFALDLSPADDIFFHSHLLPLHLLHHTTNISPRSSIDNDNVINNNNNHNNPHIHHPTKERKKFSLSKWWEDKKNHLLKKYAAIAEPLLFSSRHKSRDLRRRPCSFSGNSNPKEKNKWMKRRGEFSAPASMRTSPTNSGLLLATPAGYSSSSESSMEELQSAIQAAIAHCKNSTGTAAKGMSSSNSSSVNVN